MKKRVLTVIFSAILLLSSAISFSGCSKPPEYSEIEERFKELVEASYEINKILFGEGLPTYERVYEPSINYYVNEDEKRYYYYEIEDDELGKVVAYRLSTLITKPYSYLRVSDTPIDGLTAVYVNSEDELYYYSIEYTEKEYDFYYSDSDPDDYDYVSEQSEYQTVDQIKIAAEKIYSKDYLEASVYEALFTGAVVSDNVSGLSARYIEYQHSILGSVLMQSNTYKPLVSEKRIFDFSTAEMVKPSNKKLVNIEVETYLESSPEERVTVRVTMVLVNGEWYLDSGTY